MSLTANGNANSYLWTPGGATTKVINVNPAVTTKYKVSYSYGNHGCTIDDSATVVVNPIPTVDPITDQENCYNASTAAINFTGAVSGTTFSWTNSNPAIGLAASGNGNIPSFIATNGTAAPIFGTITVTPSANGCAGTPFSFKIYVANQASITSVTADSTCAPSGVVNLSATGNGLIKWYDALTGGNLLNTGNAYSPTISATTTYYVEAETHATPSQAIALPGGDINEKLVSMYRGNWQRAQLPDQPVVRQVDALASKPPGNTHEGVMLLNPPYGERLVIKGGRGQDRDSRDAQDEDYSPEPENRFELNLETGRQSAKRSSRESLKKLQAQEEQDPKFVEFLRQFGQHLKDTFGGWNIFVLTADMALPGQLRIKESKRTPLFNGPLECRLFKFEMHAKRPATKVSEED